MVHVYMPGTARRTGCLRCRCPSIAPWSATPSTGGRGMFVHSGTVLWQEKAKFHTESTWNLIDFLSRWLFYMLNLTQPGTAWYPLTMEPGFARHWRTNWMIAPRGTLPKFWGHLWLWNDNQDVGWGVFGKPSPICVNVQAVGSCSLSCRWWSLNFWTYSSLTREISHWTNIMNYELFHSFKTDTLGRCWFIWRVLRK